MVARWGGWGTDGWEIDTSVWWGAGPGPGVVGAEEEGVPPGVRFSTTHILREIVSTGLEGRSGVREGQIPVSFCGDQLSDRMGERRMRVYVEDWVRIFAIIHATGGEDDRDEVYASVFE